MRWAALFIVGLAMVATRPVCAQANLWASCEVFGEKEGFQNNYAAGQISQDKEGLLWVGGDNGLYSFDGTHFTNYRHITGNDSSLPFNVAIVNYPDKAGNYWVAVYNKGLYRFDPVHRSFRRFEYPGMDRFNIHQYRINCFLEDGPLLWMVLPGYGLACWDRQASAMRQYKICPPGSCGYYRAASWVTTMIKDPAGDSFWISSNDGLLQFWPATGACQVYRPPVLLGDDRKAVGAIFTHLLMDEAGLLWCGTWGRGLLSFDRTKKIFTSYAWQRVISGTQNICTGLFIGNARQLWVASVDQGLMLFDKRTGRFRKVRSPGKPDEVIQVVSCFQNDGRTMWVTDQKKLYRYNLDTSRFAWYPVVEPEHTKNTPRLAGIYNFIQTKGKLYTGAFYDGGFGSYDLATNRFSPRQLTPQLDNEAVLHLSQDKDGIIWIGTPLGTYWYDPVTDKILSPPKVDSSEQYFKSHCRDICHARDGSHWLATGKGLIRYDPAKQAMEVFDTLQPPKHRLPSLPVYDVYEDSKGRIWIGTLGDGVSCYIPGLDSVVHIKPDFSPVQEIHLSFCEDKNGNILFITSSLGIVILENPFTKAQKMTLCNSSNYLPTDFINGIFRDSKNRIWLNTSNGLLLFDPLTKNYTPFRAGDGLMDDNIESYPYQDSTGRMYLGFSYGFQSFHPDSLLAKPAEKLHIRLNSLATDGKPWPQHPAYITAITLQPYQVNMAFSFAMVGKSLSGHYSYAYMLEGIDKGWNYTGSGTTGQYNNLPPGKYMLRIKAATGNNQWVGDYFGMPVVVLPAWYQTIWFKMLLVLVIIFVIYSVFSYRLKQVRREAALKESFHQRINELELRSLRAQMNPHFIFNSLSSINRYIVKSDHKTASNYLTKFSKLIRLILDNSAVDTISVEKELQTLQLYIDLEALRFDHAFTYSIQVDEAIDQEDTFIPPMLLQPYVENAIWHGLLHKDEGKGELKISVSQLSPTMLVARIEDNGVGRQKAKEMKSKEAVKKKSYGMQLSHDRLELLNELKQESSVTIEDMVGEDGAAGGTRVVLHIPVQNKPL